MDYKNELAVYITLDFPPALNMAVDELLLEKNHTILRLYSWKPAGVSIGRTQKPEEININFCRRNNIQIVRRLSGGKAIFHHRELTYSFFINKNLLNKSDSVINTYIQINEPIMNALNSLGIKAGYSKNKIRKITASNCFQLTSMNEIETESKKLVGSAQYRSKEKILQHGSILLDYDIDLLKSIFPDFKEYTENFTGIFNITNDIIEEKYLINLILNEFSKNYTIKQYNLTEHDIQKASELVKTKYSDSFLE